MPSYEKWPAQESGVQELAVETGGNNYKKTLEEERGFFEKLRGKAREVAGVMLLMTALSSGPGLIKEAWAEQNLKKGTKVESIQNEKPAIERAKGYLSKLSRIKAPDNVNETLGKTMTNRASRVMIQSFAAQENILKAGGTDEDIRKGVFVSPQDLANIIKQLKNAIDGYADAYLGNNDGKTDQAERKAWDKASAENPGFKTLLEMIEQYK